MALYSERSRCALVSAARPYTFVSLLVWCVIGGSLEWLDARQVQAAERPKSVDTQPLLPAREKPPRAGATQNVRARTLDNGLRIVVWPDHDIPNVVMYNFVRAGGRNEHPGITGLSHFFEHMMFNGTRRRAQGEFDKTMEAAGGANNAYTSRDFTVYQDWFPRSALETIFDLEGDRLENLAIDPDVVESERSVVYSERRLRYENDNFGRLFLEMNATAFIAHPYQFPVIGWASDVESWTQQDLESYFRTYYAPNNLTMVFSGDVGGDEIFRLAEKYFGALAAQKPPQAVRTKEPEQLGERRILVEVDAPTPLLHVSFHAGSATDPDTQAMNVLLNVLVGGESSRLYRALVDEEQVALTVDGFQMEGIDPGLVYFYLTLPPDADIAAVEGRLLGELARVADDGVTPAELEKARNIMVADYWRSLSTINGKAAAIGRAEVFLGSYERAFTLPDELQQINVAQIQAVATKVFDRHHMTVGVLRSAQQEAR